MSEFRRVVTPRVAEGDAIRQEAHGASKTFVLFVRRAAMRLFCFIILLTVYNRFQL